MVATSREMLFNSQGLVVNAYHDAEGRQNYFPGSSGTSEGQFAMVSGCLKAYLATGDELGRDLGELALSGILATLYRNGAVPDEVKEKEIFAPHWLFNVKYEFRATTIKLYETFIFDAGKAIIPDPTGLVRYTFHARSLNSVLLWDNPYSSLSTGQFYPIASTAYIEGVGVEVTLSTAYSGRLYVAYSKRDGQLIEPNDPFEAWPDWRPLERGEIDCAVDTLVWAEHAYALAYQVFGNPTWREAARATREQAAQAFDINDSRDWIKPSWSDDPFSVGSSFSFSSRFPAPVFARDETGRILIIAGKGTGEVQYGNASRLDHYNEGDQTIVTMGSSKPLQVKLFIDKFQTATTANRYIATLQLAGTGMQTFTLHLSDFLSMATQEPLQAGDPVYTVGVITNTQNAHSLTIERIRQTPPLDVKYYPGAIPFTANFLGSPAQLIDWRGPVYAGYQSPDMWVTIGNQAAAATCVELLRDAQDAFLERTGGTLRGPFAPVFFFNRADAVQYGPPDTFGWEGPDPNTRWAGYQYRPLVELAKSTWVLEEPARTMAAQCVTDFHDFLADDTVWVPGEAAPSDYPPEAPLGQALYKEPHFAALILRSVIYYDQHVRPGGDASGVMRPNDVHVMDKCVSLLTSMWQTSGVMRGTFSGSPETHEWYGFHHAEILTTLAIAIEWGEGPANKPALAAQARLWIKDMLRWARANIYLDPSEYGVVLWSPAADWKKGVDETFTFQTGVTKSFSGREQRRALRDKPRRQLTLRHTLGEAENRTYDSLVRRYQNRPMLVPQWHLAQMLIEDAAVGSKTIVVSETVSEFVEWGGYVALGHGEQTVLVQVESFDDNVINLVEPLTLPRPAGTRLLPTMRGLMNTDLSVSQLTSAVMQAEVTFDILPQEDRRELPVTPAPKTFTTNGDTREVITLRPNWSSSMSLQDTWAYTNLSYAEGPFTIMQGEDEGRRVVRANWTLINREQINSFLGLLNRLQGSRVACWLPSGLLDFEVSRNITGNRLFVGASSLADARLAIDPATGVIVRLIDGTLLPALVNSAILQTTGEYELVLDRALPATDMGAVAMVNLMYRVRAASDSVTLNWLTDSKAEVTMSFTTVFGETTRT